MDVSIAVPGFGHGKAAVNALVPAGDGKNTTVSGSGAGVKGEKHAYRFNYRHAGGSGRDYLAYPDLHTNATSDQNYYHGGDHSGGVYLAVATGGRVHLGDSG